MVVKRLLMTIELVVRMLAAESDAVSGVSSVTFSRIPAEFDGERAPAPGGPVVVPAGMGTLSDRAFTNVREHYSVGRSTEKLLEVYEQTARHN